MHTVKQINKGNQKNHFQNFSQKLSPKNTDKKPLAIANKRITKIKPSVVWGAANNPPAIARKMPKIKPHPKRATISARSNFLFG